MSEKIFKTRIQLKYDTYENWITNNPVLKSGEIAIATVPVGDRNNVSTSLPAVLLKVGDGSTQYKNLNFISAKSADVYDWAKSPVKPSYSASEITGLNDYISGQIKDTDTQYRLVLSGNIIKLQSKQKGQADTNFTDVSEITLPDNNTTYTFAEGTTNGAFVVTPHGKSPQTISIHGLKSATFTDSSEYDRAGSASAVLGTSGDNKSAKTVYGAIAAANEALGIANDAMPKSGGDFTGYVSNASAPTVDKHLANKKYVDDQIKANVASVFKFKGTKDTFANLPKSGATEGDVWHVTEKHTEYVYAKVDGSSSYTWEELGGVVDLTEYVTKSELQGKNYATKTEVSTAKSEAISTASTDATNKVSAAKNQIIGTSGDSSSTNTIYGAKKKITEEINKLANIAKTGNVTDLTQSASDILIFDCGTSSTIM